MDIKQTLKIIKDGGTATFRPSWAACIAGDAVTMFISFLMIAFAAAGAAFAITGGEYIQTGAAFFGNMFSPALGEAIKSYHPTSVVYLVFGLAFFSELAIVIINRYSAEYRIDNTTVFASEGFLAKDTLSAPINQGILPTTSQSLLGRIFNYGDVSITVNTDSVATDTEVRFRDISSPDTFVDLLEKASTIKRNPRRDYVGVEE